jgi:hypothetical protein
MGEKVRIPVKKVTDTEIVELWRNPSGTLVVVPQHTMKCTLGLQRLNTHLCRCGDEASWLMAVFTVTQGLHHMLKEYQHKEEMAAKQQRHSWKIIDTQKSGKNTRGLSCLSLKLDPGEAPNRLELADQSPAPESGLDCQGHCPLNTVPGDTTQTGRRLRRNTSRTLAHSGRKTR